jgi:hypothetical protein
VSPDEPDTHSSSQPTGVPSVGRCQTLTLLGLDKVLTNGSGAQASGGVMRSSPGISVDCARVRSTVGAGGRSSGVATAVH